MLRLNPTRLRRFLTCEYDWYCYAVLGIEQRATRGGAGRDRGKAMHALLEHAIREYANTGHVFDFAGPSGHAAAEAVFQDLFDEEGTAISEYDAQSLLAAVRYHVPLLNLSQWEVMEVNGTHAIEIELRAPSGVDGVELQAIIDVVFRHRVTGEVWLIDWKTTYLAIDVGNLPPHCANNYQLEIGRQVLAHHGVKVDVAALVHIRSIAPQPPEITASRRKVTRNKALISCDWATYRQAIVDNGEDPNADDVLAVQEYLSTATFVRWRVDITDDAGQANLGKQITAAAERMAAINNGALALRNLRDTNGKGYRGCTTCDYFKWCTAGMRTATGGDADLSLLGIDYKTRPGSPLKVVYSDAKPYDPDAAYLRFAAERGQSLEPYEEFRP